MNCYKIYNDFWRKHHCQPFTTVEFAVFHYIVHCYDLRRGENPLAIPTRDFEARLLISRSQLLKARKTLCERGLISFINGSRHNAPVYTLLGVNIGGMPSENDAASASFFMPSSASPSVHGNATASATNNDTLSNISKISKDSIESDDKEKENLSKTRAREKENSEPAHEIESDSTSGSDPDLERFDRLASEVRQGHHAIWADQTAKKLRIDDVKDYLERFRTHAISNSTLGGIRDINDFKRYFNIAFRYFGPKAPGALLDEYEKQAPESSVEFRNYCRWMRQKLPRLANALQPITEKQFDFIFSIFPKQKVVDTLWRLNDHPHTLDRHLTLYEPLTSWLDKAH